MGIILQGPINTETVTNLLTSVSRAFFEKKGYRNIESKTEFWKPEVITAPNLKLLPEDAAEMYRQLIQSKRIDYLTKEPKEFATRSLVGIEDNYHYKCWMVMTDVLNLTSIEDLASGQIIPPVVKKFFITSESLRYRFDYNSETTWSYFDEFVKYRNQMIEQAQERLDQSISKAAYNIVNDLHS